MSAKLQEMEQEIANELRAILQRAQLELRGTGELLTEIPDAMIGNGAAGSIRTILSLLAKSDEQFITALKSINDTYGDAQ